MKMASLASTLAVAVMLVAVLVPAATAAACPCELQESQRYPDMLRWDCYGLALTAVPSSCFSVQRRRVAELVLSYNQIIEIRSTSLAELTELKELRLDNNNINFFDVSAMEFMTELKIFNINHNLNLKLEYDTFSTLKNLEELSTIGTNLGTLPNTTLSPILHRIDLRDSKLTSLPVHGLLHPEHYSDSFYLSAGANSFTDIPASAIIEIPNDATIFLDDFVKVWARTEDERQDIQAKTWDINIDLATATKLCEVDGLPNDNTICFDQ